MLAPIKMSWINWNSSDLACLATGGASLIYRLLPGLVAKVGLIAHEEVAIQRYVAARGKALPVLDYASALAVAPGIRTAFCPVHGIRQVVATSCTCQQSLAVLLMPEATAPQEYSKKHLQAFRRTLVSLCRTHLRYEWQDKPQHLAVYHDHLVALDFGNPAQAAC